MFALWPSTGIAYALSWLIVIGALFVVPRNRKPGSATAWLMLIVLLPFVGLALFFLIVDFARGTPLNTPAFLASVSAGRETVDASAPLIALYTLIHFALFIVV